MGFRYMSVFAGVGLMLMALPILPPGAIAPSIAQTLDCSQERRQADEAQILALQQQVGESLKTHPLAQTSPIGVRLLRAVADLEDRQIRSNFLSTLLVDEDSSADQSLLTQMIQQGMATEGTIIALEPVLVEAEAALNTLNGDYSFLKTRGLIAIAHAYTLMEDPAQAQILLHRALDAHQRIQGAEFQAIALTSLAAAYLEVEQPEQAIALLSQAQTHAGAVQEPDPIRKALLLTPIAQTYARAGAVEQAVAMARQLGHYPDGQGSTLLEAVRTQLEAGQIEDALALARSIPQNRYRALALVELAHTYQTQNQASQANQTLAQAIAAARSVNEGEANLLEIIRRLVEMDADRAFALTQDLQDPERRAIALRLLMQAYLQQGQTEQATRVVDQLMLAIRQIPEATNDEFWAAFQARDAIDEAIAAGGYRQAIRLTQLPNFAFFYPPNSLLAIATTAAAAGDLDAAVEALQAMPVADSSLMTPDYSLRAQGLPPVVMAYVRADRLDQAVALVEEYGTGYPLERIVGLTAIARQLHENGDTPEANRYFAQARQVTDRLENPQDQINGLRAIALAHEATGQTDQVEQTVSQILQVAPSIQDPFYRGYWLKAVIESLVQVDRYDMAFQVLAGLPQEFTSYEISYDPVLRALVDQAMLDQRYEVVMQAMELTTIPEDRVFRQLQVVDRYIQGNQIQAALDLLEETLPIALTIEDPESRMLYFGVDGLTQVEDPNDRASALEAIALRYAQQGYPDLAQQTLEAIQDPNLRRLLHQRLLCFNPSA